MEIETKKASVDTLTVTINALHVGKKQMTLAVFKQLPEGVVFEENGKIKPCNLWGFVRYPIKFQGDLWLIYDRDGKLYRGEPYFRFYESSRDIKHDIAKKKDIIEWIGRILEYRKSGGPGTYPANVPHAYRGLDVSEGAIARRKKEISDLKEYLKIAKNAEASRKIIEELPQLFIAI